jgi:putative flippase GtrA
MKLIGQAFRFAVVGVLATLIHVAIGLALAEGAGMPAFWANFAAFGAAVIVSYFGNLAWTFGLRNEGFARLPRFLVIALAGLLLNQGTVFAAVGLLGWSYRVALALVVMVVPLLTFTLSRRWAFTPLAGSATAD